MSTSDDVDYSACGVVFEVSCPECSWDEYFLPKETWRQYCPECGEATEAEPEYED